MAVYRNEKGRLVVEFSAGASCPQEYAERLRALVRLLQEKRSDISDGDEGYYTLDLLKDMLPDEDQCKAFLDGGRRAAT